jgi:hypothetical protein
MLCLWSLIKCSGKNTVKVASILNQAPCHEDIYESRDIAPAVKPPVHYNIHSKYSVFNYEVNQLIGFMRETILTPMIIQW